MRTTLATVLAFVCLSPFAQAQSEQPAETAAQAATPAATSATNDTQLEGQTEDFWMRQKLEYSKAILQSLTAGEFKTLASEADKMRRLSKIEGFVRRRNEPYRKQLQAFNRANAALVRSAEESDMKASLKAFHQLTSSCVACHQLLRESHD